MGGRGRMMKTLLARHERLADQAEIGFGLGWICFALIYGIGEAMSVGERGLFSWSGLLYTLIVAVVFATGTLWSKMINRRRREASYRQGAVDGFRDAADSFFYSFDRFNGGRP